MCLSILYIYIYSVVTLPGRLIECAVSDFIPGLIECAVSDLTGAVD